MKLLDFLYLAFRNLQRRKLRSWLTTLGIIIGIATVVSIVSLSKGMEKAIVSSLEKMGKDKIMILPGQKSFSPGTLFVGKPFSEEDVKKIERLPDIEYVIPITFTTKQIIFKNEIFPTIIYAVPVDKKIEVFGYELLDGRFLSKNDKNKCRVLLGYQIAKHVFSKEIEVGDKIIINNYECKVVGILKSTGSRFDDYAIYLPYSFAKEHLGMKDINLILVKAEDIEKAKKELEKLLEKIRGKDFSILTPEQFIEQVKTILNILSFFVTIIASISLLVSAIGIMNTMYMAVVERIREIGILKAIGARKRDIMLIFLLESGLMGLIGGIIGTFVGILLSYVAEYIAQNIGLIMFKAYIDPLFIIGVLIFAFFVGVISGILPARSAANLDPVKALRYE